MLVQSKQRVQNHYYLATMLFMQGRATPSAMPSKARIARSAHNEVSAAQGVKNVASDHKATPQPMTILPP